MVADEITPRPPGATRGGSTPVKRRNRGRRNEKAGPKAGFRIVRSGVVPCQPTISAVEKKKAISVAAVSGASEPWTEFSPIETA